MLQRFEEPGAGGPSSKGRRCESEDEGKEGAVAVDFNRRNGVGEEGRSYAAGTLFAEKPRYLKPARPRLARLGIVRQISIAVNDFDC